MEEPKQPSLAQRLRSIGIPKSYAYQLAGGDRTPSIALARRIEHSLKIPISAWPQPKKSEAA